jgi:hypothetical protein
MIATFHKLFSELESELSNIEHENDLILKRSELSFYACKKALSKLKEIIVKHKFKNEAEEIKFFKETWCSSAGSSNKLRQTKIAFALASLFKALSKSYFAL